MISTDKIAYGTSDNVTITYGADASGHVAIYLLNPEQQVTLLKETAVERDKVYKLRAAAISPSGEHVLVAVFNARAKARPGTEAFVAQLLTSEPSGKDLRVVEEPDTYALHRFMTR